MHGRPPVRWPALVGAIPPLADLRVDRHADRELAGAVAGPGGQTVVLCQVVSGLGGVGKTQVAAALARRLWNSRQVDLMVWVAASSRTAIVTGFAAAADRVTGLDDTDPEHAATRLLAWLAEPHQRPWLIVLDNLDNPDDLTGLWPPTTVGGHTVVTSRRRDTALLDGRHLIDVDVFTPQQAAGYLQSKLADQPRRLDEVNDLAADLGYLPLALAQAVAYIRDRGDRMTCARYRQRLADQRRRLSDLAPDALPDQHGDTVAATWSLSIDHADQLTPAGLARPVLELAALLDPNGIPIAVLTTDLVADYCTRRLGRPVDADDLEDALHTLHRFSLATIDGTARIVRVHGLLQRAVRDATDLAHQAQLATTTADALLEFWPPIERDASDAEAMRANTAALHTAAAIHLWTRASGVHPVLAQAGRSLGASGLVRSAIDYFQYLHSQAAQWLDPDHADILTIRGELARWRGEAGDPAGAAAAFEELLTDHLRALGPDHPDTLIIRHEIAFWRGHAGDPAGAATAFEQLLTDQLRVLGSDHPDTLSTRHNLAFFLGQAGDPAGAAAALEQLLTDRLRVLGPDHPGTMSTRGALARWRGRAGDSAGAAAMLEQLLTDRLRVLGPDHPDTLTARNNLAYWRGQAGDPAGAAAALEQLVSDVVRVLGPDHPGTMSTSSNLAQWRGRAGDSAGAAAALEQLLTDRLRVLGPDHPDTMSTRSNLARWRGEAGDPAGAAAALEQLLPDQLRVLGPDHPDTLSTRHSLANWRRQAGSAAGPAEPCNPA